MNNSERDRSKFGRLGYTPALAVLFVGTVLSYFGFVRARSSEDRALEARFGRAADARAAAISRTVESRLLAVDALYAYLEAADLLNQSALDHFAAPLFDRVAEVEMLAWVPRVAGGDRSRFEENLSLDIGFEARVHAWMSDEPISVEDEHYPLANVYPLESHRALPGLDLSTSPAHNDTLGRALADGSPRVTPPLPSLDGQDAATLWVFAPVYDAYSTHARRPSGVAVGVFRVSTVVGEAVRSFSDDITIRLFDTTDPTERRLMWQHGEARANHPFSKSRTLTVAGRTWAVVCDAGPQYLREGRANTPWSLLIGGILASILLAAWVSISMHRARLIDRLARDLDRMSREDPLTGLANRRVFDLRLRREWQQSSRTGAPLSLLMLDIDHFKRYNDSMGHPEGDICLKEVAAVLATSAIRATDLPARYGGEEFAVLLPATDASGAEQVAKTILYRLQRRELPHPDSPTSDFISVSIGCATMNGTLEQAESLLVKTADRALYRAKKRGRNRVEIATAPDADTMHSGEFERASAEVDR